MEDGRRLDVFLTLDVTNKVGGPGWEASSYDIHDIKRRWWGKYVPSLISYVVYWGPTIKNSYYFMLSSCLICWPFLHVPATHLTSESELASTARRPNLGQYAILNTGMLCDGWLLCIDWLSKSRRSNSTGSIAAWTERDCWRVPALPQKDNSDMEKYRLITRQNFTCTTAVSWEEKRDGHYG